MKSNTLVFDLEANSAVPKEVTNLWCCVIKDMESKKIYKFQQDEMAEAVKLLATADRLIGHFVLSYDMRVLNHLYGFDYPGEVIDTVLLSRLSNPDRGNPPGYRGNKPHSLEAWAVRLGGEQKVAWEDWSKYDPTMLIRCESDVNITERVYYALHEEFMQ